MLSLILTPVFAWIIILSILQIGHEFHMRMFVETVNASCVDVYLQVKPTMLSTFLCFPFKFFTNISRYMRINKVLKNVPLNTRIWILYARVPSKISDIRIFTAFDKTFLCFMSGYKVKCSFVIEKQSITVVQHNGEVFEAVMKMIADDKMHDTDDIQANLVITF